MPARALSVVGGASGPAVQLPTLSPTARASILNTRAPATRTGCRGELQERSAKSPWILLAAAGGGVQLLSKQVSPSEPQPSGPGSAGPAAWRRPGRRCSRRRKRWSPFFIRQVECLFCGDRRRWHAGEPTGVVHAFGRAALGTCSEWADCGLYSGCQPFEGLNCISDDRAGDQGCNRRSDAGRVLRLSG